MKLIELKDGVISGMILGDGNLKKGKPLLRLCHTSPQLGYLKLKLNLAKQLGYSVKLYQDTVFHTNLGSYKYSTGVIKDGDIDKFYNMTLLDLVNNLNSLGLLLWWLDDGSLSIHHKKNGSVSRFGYLNTQGYGLDGNILIQQKLYDLFMLETKIHIDSKSGLAKRDHYRIYLNAVNMRRLIDLVREFITWIPKDMLYKLNMQYVVNKLKDSEYLAMNYNF